MAKRTPEHLTRREREIMQAIFALNNRASAEDILGVASIIGLQAIEYRKLYPADEQEEAPAFANRATRLTDI